MSSALVWELVKNNNAFLIKRGRTARGGAVAFSSESGNLLNVNSYKFSGLAQENTVDVASDLSLRKKTAELNKPAKSFVEEKLSLHGTKGAKKVADAVANYRADLSSAAKIRFNKVARATAVKKGYSKKAAKSTRRQKM